VATQIPGYSDKFAPRTHVSVYEIITGRIIEGLEKGKCRGISLGVLPFRQTSSRRNPIAESTCFS